MKATKLTIATAGLLLSILFFKFASEKVFAHCDTIDGPVIKDAKLAISKADIKPVLKWIKKENEKELQTVFEKTLKVRSAGPQAQELADMYFFETLVRLHREGEGAPYMGLKAAGTVEPIIAAADKAIEENQVDALVKEIETSVGKGIRERFRKVVEAKKHSEDNTEAGREYVEAYVQFVHYVEALHNTAAATAAHTEPALKDEVPHIH